VAGTVVDEEVLSEFGLAGHVTPGVPPLPPLMYNLGNKRVVGADLGQAGL
jgi:hypothetical protein